MLAVALVLGVGATAGAAVIGFDGGLGGPAPRYGNVPPEPGLRYSAKPLLLARTVNAAGPRFEIVGYRLARRGGSSPDNICLDLVVLPSRGASGCLTPTGYVQGTSSGALTGAADVEDARVVVSYRTIKGERQTSEAEIARATSYAALKSLGLEPFAIWKASMPRGAYDRRVRGIAADGSTRWRAVDPNELAACASAPRSRRCP